MKFQMRTATAAKVHFVPTDLIYSGPIDMTEFSLANYTVQDSIDSEEFFSFQIGGDVIRDDEISPNRKSLK